MRSLAIDIGPPARWLADPGRKLARATHNLITLMMIARSVASVCKLLPASYERRHFNVRPRAALWHSTLLRARQLDHSGGRPGNHKHRWPASAAKWNCYNSDPAALAAVAQGKQWPPVWCFQLNSRLAENKGPQSQA